MTVEIWNTRPLEDAGRKASQDRITELRDACHQKQEIINGQAERLKQAEAELRKFYKHDGTYEEYDADIVKSMRMLSAVHLHKLEAENRRLKDLLKSHPNPYRHNLRVFYRKWRKP